MKIILTSLFLILASLYLPLNDRVSIYNFRSAIDNYIPLIPNTVWFYISYLAFIPTAIALIWKKQQIKHLLTALIIGTIIASLIWLFFPNGVVRPQLEPSSLSTTLLAYIYSHDNDTNGFPSGHVLHTVIAGYYLALAIPKYKKVWITVAILICISTITTKQHYAIDIIGGATNAILAIYLTHRLSRLFPYRFTI